MADRCVPVQGKIVNNFGLSSASTIGVVSMVYGPKTGGVKLKCALNGTQTPGPTPADILFTHSISCDDAMSMPAADGSGDVPVHSSIVMSTIGNFLPPQSPTEVVRFREVSVPIAAAPKRGLFAGVTGGQIVVEGAVYKPTAGLPAGSIDMTFEGEVCYPN
jgi:hypothetical protein